MQQHDCEYVDIYHVFKLLFAGWLNAGTCKSFDEMCEQGIEMKTRHIIKWKDQAITTSTMNGFMRRVNRKLYTHIYVLVAMYAVLYTWAGIEM